MCTIWDFWKKVKCRCVDEELITHVNVYKTNSSEEEVTIALINEYGTITYLHDVAVEDEKTQEIIQKIARRKREDYAYFLLQYYRKVGDSVITCFHQDDGGFVINKLLNWGVA